MSAPQQSATKASDPASAGSLQPIPPLSQLIQSTASCTLRPLTPLVAWHGVLTLAFSGFPRPLAHLKQQINVSYASTLKAENSGSQWPKSTLGCLNEGVVLTATQLQALQQICADFAKRFAATSSFDAPIGNASVVLFASRSLERTLHRSDVPLLPRPSASDTKASSSAPEHTADVVDAAAQARVQVVVKESSGVSAEQYLPMINRTGYRALHYSSACVESTLVCFLFNSAATVDSKSTASSASAAAKAEPAPSALCQVLREFRAAVDTALPNLYTWFAESALHVTLRSLS